MTNEVTREQLAALIEAHKTPEPDYQAMWQEVVAACTRGGLFLGNLPAVRISMFEELFILTLQKAYLLGQHDAMHDVNAWADAASQLAGDEVRDDSETQADPH